jgi:SAM-dependent methyltransferase
VSDEHRREWEDRHGRGGAPAAPSPFVLAALDAIACRGGAPTDSLSSAVHAPLSRRALDVACGGGRHARVLAARGYHVVAVDYARAAVRTAREHARPHAIAGLVADVAQWPLPAARFDVVIVVDFLERALLPALRATVVPGGVLVMETFMVGQERHGHPRNPAYLLEPGELRDACRGWTVLLAHEGEQTVPAPVCRAGIAAERPVHVDSTEPFGSIGVDDTDRA